MRPLRCRGRGVAECSTPSRGVVGQWDDRYSGFRIFLIDSRFAVTRLGGAARFSPIRDERGPRMSRRAARLLHHFSGPISRVAAGVASLPSHEFEDFRSNSPHWPWQRIRFPAHPFHKRDANARRGHTSRSERMCHVRPRCPDLSDSRCTAHLWSMSSAHACRSVCPVPMRRATRRCRPGRSALLPRLGRIRKLGLLRAEEADEKHPRQQQASGGRSHSRYRKSIEEI